VTREPASPPEPVEPSGPEAPDPHRLGPTAPGVLVALALLGLVVGWAVRPASVAMGDPAPRVGWLPPLALLLVALILGYAAWTTHRLLQRPPGLPGERPAGRLLAHQAVNRLVLAKSCALVGALVGGGYVGYALTWAGMSAERAGERMLHSAVAGVAGGLIVAASLLLERACRVRKDDDPS
jgi:hypothetical protein